MTLESIMTKHVVTVSMDDTLEQVREIFAKFRFHHVVVLDHCRVVGVISDRDLLMHLSPYAGKTLERALDAASLKKKAHQIMTRDPMTAAPSMPAGEAALLLLSNHNSCLPVLDEVGACVGIVTLRDMLRWSLEHLTDNACPLKLRQNQAA